jgi:hypothetical protein
MLAEAADLTTFALNSGIEVIVSEGKGEDGDKLGKTCF